MGEEEDYIPIATLSPPLRMTPALRKMGSDESHFNVSLIVRDKVTRQCPQTTTFEEKGLLKRIRTEVPLLTNLTPYRWAKPAHIVVVLVDRFYIALFSALEQTH